MNYKQLLPARAFSEEEGGTYLINDPAFRQANNLNKEVKMKSEEKIERKLEMKRKMLDTASADNESDSVVAIAEARYYNKHKLIARTLEWVLGKRDYKDVESGIIS